MTDHRLWCPARDGGRCACAETLDERTLEMFPEKPVESERDGAECTYADILSAVTRLWPLFYARSQDNDFMPIVDGHWRVGFSIRLFGPGGSTDPSTPARRASAWTAMEQLQCALEDIGFDTTRDGNAWQDGRLVLGWATTSEGSRIADLPADHPARAERIARLARERTARRTAQEDPS